MALGHDAEPSNLKIVLSQLEDWPAKIVVFVHDAEMRQLVIEKRPRFLGGRPAPPVSVQSDFSITPA